ncbi:MAG: hypothetical protein JKX74_10005, partial [Flavobacteriales bacterium]|nr:hypothetical protein [Flavobacteriales bacterium]
MKKYILLFITITAFSFSTMAVNRNSTGSANWDVAGTWSPSGIPTSSDNVTILEGHQVTIPSGITAYCDNLNLGDNSFGGGVTQCIVGESGVGSATLNVSGILQYSIGGGTACNLNIREASTVSITGNVVFDAGGTSDRLIFSAGASTVNVGGTFGADGTVIGGSTNGSTINFNSSTVSQVIQVSGTSFDYDNITCNNTTSGGVTLAGNLTASDINGNFTVQTGTLDMGSNSITGNVGKTFQIDAGATMEFSTATINWPADFGTITNNGIVDYSFAGAQTLSDQDYSSLILSGSGAKNLPATSTVTATGTL